MDEHVIKTDWEIQEHVLFTKNWNEGKTFTYCVRIAYWYCV